MLSGVGGAIVTHTPVLSSIVGTHLHSGFWDAYRVVREDVHRALRKELFENPAAKVFFVGHSLGGE